MIAIVNVSSNWGIGAGGDMLVHISADLKRFKALTEGKTVVMGRATLVSLPRSRPLKNRRNIVLTSRPDDLPDGCVGVCSVRQLLELVGDGDDVVVIGGETVYRQMLSLCSRVYVTKAQIDTPAERFFPDLDILDDWYVENESETYEENGIRFKYVDYQKI